MDDVLPRLLQLGVHELLVGALVELHPVHRRLGALAVQQRQEQRRAQYRQGR